MNCDGNRKAGLCRDCESAPAEYMATVTGLAANRGRCVECHEKAVRMAMRDQSMATKRTRTRGHGYTGGTGYKVID